MLSAETWFKKGVDDPDYLAIKGKKLSYQVKLYDLELKGNAPIDYDPVKYGDDGKGQFIGAFREGLSIGGYIYDTFYYIDINNITASAYHTALKLTNVVGNGKVANAHVYNCYSTGINTRSSIITLENIKIGICGATGIELGPEESDKAGLDGNEKSKVTITGTIEASTNLNAGNTNYFKYYSVNGYTVPQIITGVTSAYDPNQVSHIRNSNGQFIFVSLLFSNLETLTPNQSIVEYPAYQAGGIIEMSQLPTSGHDTTHQFIQLDIMVELPGMGIQKVGVAFFYNHYYGK
jgi:hypothetical protein